jgi:cytochrome oxidase assembly protein ShyY1
LPAFKSLSDWQWRRLHQRIAFNSQMTANSQQPPLSMTQAALAEAHDEWRTVQACGQWDAAAQVLVRRRTLNTEAGFWVATPLVSPEGTITVVRGFHPNGASSTQSPTIDPTPRGQVCISARLRFAPQRMGAIPHDLPQGQADQLEAGPYLELTASTPASDSGLTMLPAPELTEGPHRSYAIQWLIFAAMTIAGWIVLVRNEIVRRRNESD